MVRQSIDQRTCSIRQAATADVDSVLAAEARKSKPARDEESVAEIPSTSFSEANFSLNTDREIKFVSLLRMTGAKQRLTHKISKHFAIQE